MHFKQQKTRKDALGAVDKKISALHVLLIEATRKWDLSRIERRNMRLLTGTFPIGPLPLLSDFKARRKASQILIRLMSRHWKRGSTQAGGSYYFVTFVDDIGNSSDRRPEVNIDALRRKVDKAMRQMELNGIIWIEVQALMNYPGDGRGRTLMYHAHGIAWTSKPFSPSIAENRINSSRTWKNTFGAPPLKIIAMTDRRGEIEWLAQYISKVPYDAKNRFPATKSPGKYTLRQTTAGYRPELALRVFEGLSQIELTSVVFGVGEGTAVRASWRSKLLAWHRNRISEADRNRFSFDVPHFWRDVRSRNGSKNFHSYRFLQGCERPASIHLPEHKQSEI